MAESDVGISPQVFVVDSQANFVALPGTKKPRWTQVSQKFLLLLVGMALLGLVVEGFFIYKLYKQNEEFLSCKSYSLCQNLSVLKTSAQQGGNIMGRVGHEVKPQPQQIQKRPFAHLMGSSAEGRDNIVQWVDSGGDSITYNMSYNNSRLSVKKEGYYYLYSNVQLQLNVGNNCVIQHSVMKETKAYGKPIELMKSKRRCGSLKPSNLQQSFLAGIFHLDSEDKIFVKLEDLKTMHPGPTENFMGAFLVSP